MGFWSEVHLKKHKNLFAFLATDTRLNSLSCRVYQCNEKGQAATLQDKVSRILSGGISPFAPLPSDYLSSTLAVLGDNSNELQKSLTRPLILVFPSSRLPLFRALPRPVTSSSFLIYCTFVHCAG